MATFSRFNSALRACRTKHAACAVATAGALGVSRDSGGIVAADCNIRTERLDSIAAPTRGSWTITNPHRTRRKIHIECQESPLKFTFAGKTETFTAVFQPAPTRRTASVNTNGLLLKSYARSTGNVGMKEDVYDRLYSAMLKEAESAPGTLRKAPPQAHAAMNDLGFIGCFSCVPAKKLYPGAVYGAVFIDVYKPQFRPLSDKNVALIYIEGPCGQNTNAGPFSTHRPYIQDLEDFLSAVEGTAANVMFAVREYNRVASASRGNFPVVDVLQYCLVSGSITKHPDASKLDVAVASVRGLKKGALVCNASVPVDLPVVHFTYDEGIFEEAVCRVDAQVTNS